MNKYDHLSRYKIDFEESHYNLSLKDYHLFNYIEEKCQEMDFLFKGDDDILLIPENLMYHINFLRERSVSIFYFNRPNGPKSIFNFFSFKKFHFYFDNLHQTLIHLFCEHNVGPTSSNLSIDLIFVRGYLIRKDGCSLS